MLESPVLELQKQSGATVTEAHGWNIPAVYSTLDEEYRAATQSMGLVDRSYVGRLKVSGDDALDLLDRLSTNKLADLEVGKVMGTVLTTNKGRIIDLLFVLRQDDHLIVFTSPETRQQVADWIDFYTFVEDVTVQDVTEETAMLAILGPEAPALVGELSLYESVNVSIEGIDALAVRTDFASTPGYDLIVDSAQAQAFWTALVSKGATPIGSQTLDAIRIEQGIPAHGSELSEDYNPLEANLIDFISFNKGCYIGQEVVARLNTYDKVQKHLVSLSWDASSQIVPGIPLKAEGKEVGAITSASAYASDGKAVGLGFVRKAHASTGTELSAGDDEVSVTVKELVTP